MSIISKSSDWDEGHIASFLGDTTIPLRVSVLDDCYPLICSLWFEYEEGSLVCVSHKDAKLTRLLQKEGRCGFEVAKNEPPYAGVRGKADVRVLANRPEERLRRLIARYLGGSNQRLAQWLLGRIDDEYEIQLTPTWMTAWDYTERMDN